MPLASLDALMSKLLLFEELFLKDMDEEVIVSLDAVHGKKAFKGVQALLKDETLFKISASISIYFHRVLLFTLVGLFLT